VYQRRNSGDNWTASSMEMLPSHTICIRQRARKWLSVLKLISSRNLSSRLMLCTLATVTRHAEGKKPHNTTHPISLLPHQLNTTYTPKQLTAILPDVVSTSQRNVHPCNWPTRRPATDVVVLRT
jgi:hypothetical protein